MRQALCDILPISTPANSVGEDTDFLISSSTKGTTKLMIVANMIN